MLNDPAFLSFVSGVAAIRENYRVTRGFTVYSNMSARAEVPAGAKFARVYSTETWAQDGKVREQIYCFVALEDSNTRTLGAVKKGDVMKPATWKAPAKHARGNIYDENNGLASCNSYGPGYLK